MRSAFSSCLRSERTSSSKTPRRRRSRRRQPSASVATAMHGPPHPLSAKSAAHEVVRYDNWALFDPSIGSQNLITSTFECQNSCRRFPLPFTLECCHFLSWKNFAAVGTALTFIRMLRPGKLAKKLHSATCKRCPLLECCSLAEAPDVPHMIVST